MIHRDLSNVQIAWPMRSWMGTFRPCRFLKYHFIAYKFDEVAGLLTETNCSAIVVTL